MGFSQTSRFQLHSALVQQKSVRRMLEVVYSCLTFDEFDEFDEFDDIWWQFVVCVWYMRVSQAWDPWPLRRLASFALPGIRDGQECRIIDHVRLSATKAFWAFPMGFPKMGDPDTIGCHPKISKPSLISKWGNSWFWGTQSLSKSLEPPRDVQRDNLGSRPLAESHSWLPTWLQEPFKLYTYDLNDLALEDFRAGVFPTCLHKVARMRPEIRIEDDWTYWNILNI